MEVMKRKEYIESECERDGQRMTCFSTQNKMTYKKEELQTPKKFLEKISFSYANQGKFRSGPSS